MFTVELSPQAVEDLQGIKSYIEDDLQNPIAAKNTMRKIVEAYEELAKFPNVGIPVQRYVDFPTDYRFILANNYSIFYRTEDGTVKVVRILYSRMDFVAALFDEV